MSQELTVIKEDVPMSPAEVKKQINLIQEIMRDAMKDGEHYGTIPGCGPKPALLKPGAEKLNMTFHMAPSYHINAEILPKDHRNFEIVCALASIGSEKFLGQGVGSCSTMESKYRYRTSERKCPKCGRENIIKGKEEYGGGWLCFAKKGGCGAKFKEDDPEITSQKVGRVEYEDPADYWNTCLKMAKKRALVDAVLTVTAASDIFTQDIEEMADFINGNSAPTPPKETEQVHTKTQGKTRSSRGEAYTKPEPETKASPTPPKPTLEERKQKALAACESIGYTQDDIVAWFTKPVEEWDEDDLKKLGDWYKQEKAQIKAHEKEAEQDAASGEG